MSVVADQVVVRVATVGDAPLILGFIRELAEYERMLDEVEATEADIRRDLFGENPRSFCEIAEYGPACGLRAVVLQLLDVSGPGRDLS
jgi:hypothetical protein